MSDLNAPTRAIAAGARRSARWPPPCGRAAARAVHRRGAAPASTRSTPRLHAFCTLDAAARARQAEAHRRAPCARRAARAAGRRAGRGQGPDLHARAAHDLRLAALCRSRARRGRRRRRAAARRRRDRHRQDQHLGIRLRRGRPQPALPDDAQSVEPGAHAGRIERRLGGGRCRGHGAARARQRRRRLGPHAGGAVRRLRHQAVLGARAGLPRLPRRAPSRASRAGSRSSTSARSRDRRRCRAGAVGAGRADAAGPRIRCPPSRRLAVLPARVAARTAHRVQPDMGHAVVDPEVRGGRRSGGAAPAARRSAPRWKAAPGIGDTRRCSRRSSRSTPTAPA